LGRITALLPGPTSGLHGRLFHEPTLDAVCVVELRTNRLDVWQCGVIAFRVEDHRPRHVQLSTRHIRNCPTGLTVDPVADPDGWVMLWRTRIFQAGFGGRQVPLTRFLAVTARTPGGLVVDLTPDAVWRARQTTHVLTVGLRRLLDQLETGGFLTPIEGGDPIGWGRYTLTLPKLDAETRRHEGTTPEDEEAPRKA
jgi:hypothetical protein